jgi:hypothetical protein
MRTQKPPVPDSPPQSPRCPASEGCGRIGMQWQKEAIMNLDLKQNIDELDQKREQLKEYL